jgi:surfactin synthase thioesterase subunit
MNAVVGRTSDPHLWLRQFHETHADAVRLVCLPYAGGSASFFHAMSAGLAPSVAAIAVQYPGRQDRRGEPLIDNIPDLAEGVLAALEAHADGPLAVFGHSMGATLAFEVARLMEERWGRSPLALFLSGRRAPSRFREERIHTLDDAGIVRHLATMEGTDPRVLGDEEILRMILPVVRNDYRAIETYRGRTEDRVSCPITVLTGDRDGRVTPDEAAGWAKHTTGDFSLTTFPGGHFYLTEQTTAVLEVLRSTLHSLGRTSDREDFRNLIGE